MRTRLWCRSGLAFHRTAEQGTRSGGPKQNQNTVLQRHSSTRARRNTISLSSWCTSFQVAQACVDRYTSHEIFLDILDVVKVSQRVSDKTHSCTCHHMFERLLFPYFVFFLSLAPLLSLSHCLPVLCLAHQLPCGRNRRGMKPLHSRTMRSIALWRYTTLSQLAQDQENIRTIKNEERRNKIENILSTLRGLKNTISINTRRKKKTQKKRTCKTKMATTSTTDRILRMCSHRRRSTNNTNRNTNTRTSTNNTKTQ